MSDPYVPTTEEVLAQAEREYERKSADHVMHCHPNMPDWDEAAWRRDYPFPGSKNAYLATAIDAHSESLLATAGADGWDQARAAALEAMKRGYPIIDGDTATEMMRALNARADSMEGKALRNEARAVTLTPTTEEKK